jgi:hypothetical protein
MIGFFLPSLFQFSLFFSLYSFFTTPDPSLARRGVWNGVKSRINAEN